MATTETIAPITEQEFLRVVRARVHNLKNVSVDIPHNAITVVTCVRGPGRAASLRVLAATYSAGDLAV